jgi:predicted nucleotidyltransferase component of viral defense system
MTKREISAMIHVHDDPVLFRRAVNYTAALTRFLPRLIEKDYFCTVLLDYLTSADDRLVFKGGTCMAKVHAGFYRLSEDLDFFIPTSTLATRAERRTLSVGFKAAVGRLSKRSGAFRVVKPLVGANTSTQYVATFGYTSLVSQQEESIKIEVGLREPLLTPVIAGEARTLLLDPISGKPMVPVLSVPCISRSEAMAEKMRAALSRREAAIRDFYDIDYAVRKLGFQPLETAMMELIQQKLAVPGNEPVDVSPGRLAALRLQINPRLKPVLRATDFAEFDLERAFRIVIDVANTVG